jgi:uncharacterized protein YjhX (UPF0386 family)
MSIADKVFEKIQEWGLAHKFTADDFVEINSVSTHRRVAVRKELRKLISINCLSIDGYVEKKIVYKVVSLNKEKSKLVDSFKNNDLGVWSNIFRSSVVLPTKARVVRF